MLYVKSPCGPCCGGTCTVGTITCVSREGSGNLRGFSRYQNFNSGDWNTRKALDELRSGTFSITYYSDDNCTNLEELPCSTSQTWTAATGSSINPATNTLTGSTNDYAFGCLGPEPDCGCEESSESGQADGTYIGGVIAFGGVTVVSDDVATYATCSGCDIYEETASINCAGSFTHTRSNFDTVHDALGRGSPTVGTNCKTTAGTIGTTSAGSATQLSITGTRSVRATIPLSGLTIGVDYTVTIEIDRYGAGGGSYVDTITEDITFTAASTSESIEYDVPVNTDYDYEFVGATVPGCSGASSSFTGMDFSSAENSGYAAIL